MEKSMKNDDIPQDLDELLEGYFYRPMVVLLYWKQDAVSSNLTHPTRILSYCKSLFIFLFEDTYS